MPNRDKPRARSYVRKIDKSLNLEEMVKRAKVSSPEESTAYFSDPNDFRWSETLQGEDSPTGKPVIHINDRKMPGAGKRYRDKMAKAESIHLYKNVHPKEYESMLSEARTDPGFDRWLRDSYDRDRVEHGEKRPLEDWVR